MITLNIKYALLFLGLLAVSGGYLMYSNYQETWQIKKHPVSIAISKTPLSTPFFVAESINAFQDTCVNVKYVDVIGGKNAFNKVMLGETDFGTSSDSVLAFQSLTKNTFVTHAMFVESDNDMKLLTHKKDNIVSVSQLVGKNIGVIKGTSSEYFLSTLLAIEGLTTKDVNLSYFNPTQLTEYFIRNELDAVVHWEPFAFNIVQLLEDQVNIIETKNFHTLSFNLVSKIPDKLLLEKATCILQGLNTAIEYIASFPEKSKIIVMNKLNLDLSFINWVWDDYIFKLSLNQSLRLNIKSQVVWVIETQMSEYNDMPNIDAFLDRRAIMQVDPGAVNIPL